MQAIAEHCRAATIGLAQALLLPRVRGVEPGHGLAVEPRGEIAGEVAVAFDLGDDDGLEPEVVCEGAHGADPAVVGAFARGMRQALTHRDGQQRSRCLRVAQGCGIRPQGERPVGE